VRYRQAGREVECETRVLVNAGGPWVNRILAAIDPPQRLRRIQLVQGSHIIVDGRVERGLYYVEVPRDGRAVFLMPWKGQTLVGTTETRFRGNPDEVRTLRAERRYLLRVLNRYFPRYDATGANSVRDAFAGLRVLPAGPGHAFHRSREVVLAADVEGARDHPRVLSIYGGKLTAWRATAEKVMSRIEGSLPLRKRTIDTRTIRLTPP
jgi:glycerol-3-phosphate dehydrogenase